MTDERVKYVQGGSGQVAFLLSDPLSGDWVIELFSGGPDPTQKIGQFATRDEAESSLAADGFEQATN